MGSPSYCYKEMMKEYISLNHYSNSAIDKMSEEELENKIKEINSKQDNNYNCFLAGVAVSNFVHYWEEHTDMLNASMGAISDIEELFNIHEE